MTWRERRDWLPSKMNRTLLKINQQYKAITIHIMENKVSQRQQQFRNFIAGLIAGFVSVTICNPLDITRTRLNIMTSPTHHNKKKYMDFGHTMRTIWKEEGFKGFYTGYRTNIFAIPLFHSLFFPIYEYTKSKSMEKDNNLKKACLLGTLAAGTIANVLTNPLWVVRTRLMVQILRPSHHQYENISTFSVLKKMVKQEGYSSLFKGLSASLFSIVNAVIYFQIYEQMKKMLTKQKQKLSILNIFISSTVAKVISSSVTYPIIVVRTVLHDTRDHKQHSFFNVAKHIWGKNGFYGFYGGLKPDLIRLIPSNAILFICYELTKKYL